MRKSCACECCESRLKYLLDEEATETGLSPVGVDRHGEMELKININSREGSVFLSREFWDSITRIWDKALVNSRKNTKPQR